MAPPGAEEVESVVAHCRRSHERLFETLGEIGGDVGAPSLLPGWTVGHVLSHLARNADSHVRMLEAARAGGSVEQYPGGAAGRARDIEDGASRAAAVVIEDVRRSALDLEGAWAAMGAAGWEGRGLTGGRPWACAEMPASRWREVEVHHVDLGRRYRSSDWPDAFVARELPLAVVTIPDRVSDDGARRRMLSWLLGRSDDPGVVALGPLPAAGGIYRRRTDD